MAKKLKIAFIEPHLKIVGGIRRILEVSNRLSQRGHLVTIYVPKPRRPKWIPLEKVLVKNIATLTTFSHDFAIFNLAEQYPQALSANAAVKVFWVLAPEAMYKDPTVPIRALGYNFFFMANSTFTAEYVKQHRKKPLGYKIPVIPGGINRKHFRYDPDMPKCYHAMYYGSARPWKGTRIIEEALDPLHLKLLKMEGLNTPQPDMYKLYNSATCYVSAGQVEGFGFPILEAMACGCPVVCTDDGGNRDFVKHNHNAIVVKRNPVDIRDAVREVINNKPLRRKLKNNGLATAQDRKYNWNTIVKTLEETLIQRIN